MKSNIIILTPVYNCLLYTSDAADDSLRVDLGGRRIIKKAWRICLLLYVYTVVRDCDGRRVELSGEAFFKQKTAYEIHERLVGSEMCIRDSSWGFIEFFYFNRK